jgi:RNA polymerase sigma-70 factor (ECF subfamily)
VGTNIEIRDATFDPAGLRMAPVPEIPDASLVAAAQAGDTGAFGSLYARYSRVVHAIILSRVPPSEVDDLVHDVFLRAFARLNDLRDASRFGAWLGSIARNLCNDFHRQSRPHGEVSQDFSEIEIADRVSNTREDGEATAALDAIRALPETYRETLFLRLVEGMTGPEIALRTGLTHGSVRVNLHRGKELLRAKMSGSPQPNQRRESRSSSE